MVRARRITGRHVAGAAGVVATMAIIGAALAGAPATTSSTDTGLNQNLLPPAPATASMLSPAPSRRATVAAHDARDARVALAERGGERGSGRDGGGNSGEATASGGTDAAGAPATTSGTNTGSNPNSLPRAAPPTALVSNSDPPRRATVTEAVNTSDTPQRDKRAPAAYPPCKYPCPNMWSCYSVLMTGAQGRSEALQKIDDCWKRVQEAPEDERIDYAKVLNECALRNKGKQLTKCWDTYAVTRGRQQPSMQMRIENALAFDWGPR